MAFIISHKKLKKVVATVLCVSREWGDKLTTYEKRLEGDTEIMTTIVLGLWD